MTRSREALIKDDIDNLIRAKSEALAIEAPLARASKLRALLIQELSRQKEADWQLHESVKGEVSADEVDSKINYSATALSCVSLVSDTEKQEEFVRKWGGSSLDDFPPLWHDFVNKFIDAMPCSWGGRVVVEYSAEVDASHYEEERATFWTEENLCKVFVNYLASLPDKTYSDLPTVTDLINSHTEIEHIKKNIIPELTGISHSHLAEQFRVKSLMLLSLRYHTHLPYPIDEDIKEIYQNWAGFHDQAKKDNINSKEYEVRIFAEWKKQHALVVGNTDNEEAKKRFAQYCTLISELHTAWQETKKLLEVKPSERSDIAYVAGGAGVGLGGGAVIAGIIAGCCALSAIPIIGLILLVITAATVGGVVGYKVKQRLDARDRDADANTGEKPAVNKPSKSLAKSCSTTICALFFGLTSCSCFAINMTDQLPNNEQQSSQENQDDATDEVELSSIATPGKRSG